MSRLFYDIKLEEEYYTKSDNYSIVMTHLPHFKEIAEWLPKEWNKCKIQNTFTGILKDKIDKCTMKCFEKKDGTAIARITIDFIPDFRLSKNRRIECWDQLDAQMSDGFGESYDHMPIPNVEHGWFLCL